MFLSTEEHCLKTSFSPLCSFFLQALSKTLITDEIIYLKTQFSFLSPNKDGFITLGSIRSALSSNATEEMKESRIPEFLALVKTRLVDTINGFGCIMPLINDLSFSYS